MISRCSYSWPGGALFPLLLGLVLGCQSGTKPVGRDEGRGGRPHDTGAVAQLDERRARQLAARLAREKFAVAKLTDGKSTRTLLTPLGGDERVEELARMLGGVSITAKAREHAREMLKPRAPEKRARR